MKMIYNDGGRSKAGRKGTANDCVCRSIAIATGKPYKEIYDALNELAKSERIGKRKRSKSSARNGVYKQTYKKYLASIGWKWIPTMFIGSGCKIHLHDGELPSGTLIVSLSRHLTCVIDGVIHDTHDPQRCTVFYENNKRVRIARRCVYGYWINNK